MADWPKLRRQFLVALPECGGGHYRKAQLESCATNEGASMKTILVLGIAATLIISSVSAHGGPVSGQGTWQTTLLGRGIHGQSLSANDESAVFLYDATLNITWLKNVNRNGPMTWITAQSWVGVLQVGEFSNWRLARTLIPDASCVAGNAYPAVYSQAYGIGCTGSEMGHLFNATLGNGPDTAITNTGSFQGFENYYYWSETPRAENPYYVWTYNTAINGQAYTGTGTNASFAMAVRDGDVLQVPEPQTLALTLLALSAGAVARRRFAPVYNGCRTGLRTDA